MSEILRPMYVLISCVLMIGASFAQVNKETTVEVPFDLYKNEIILQVKVGGKGPFNMMLDTGTDPSGIDLATAKGLGLKLAPVIGKATGGGTDASQLYETRLPLIEIGGLSAKNIEALAIDLSRMSERLGKTINGILGHSLLNGRIVQIDYPGRVVRFYTKSPFPEAMDRSNTDRLTILSFRYSDNVLIDEVFVNGKKITANLDTGSDGTFKLNPAAVSYLGLEEEASRGQVTTSVGSNGLLTNTEGRLNNVRVGGISVDSPAVIFFGKGTGHDKRAWGINIGNAFLKDFILTIDYKAKLIVLERSQRVSILTGDLCPLLEN